MQGARKRLVTVATCPFGQRRMRKAHARWAESAIRDTLLANEPQDQEADRGESGRHQCVGQLGPNVIDVVGG